MREESGTISLPGHHFRSCTFSGCRTPAYVRRSPNRFPLKGTGFAKLWRPCTPAMVAGLTDRVWSLRDVLLFRVPPWPQPQRV